MNIIELYENLKGSYKHYLESFKARKYVFSISD